MGLITELITGGPHSVGQSLQHSDDLPIYICFASHFLDIPQLLPPFFLAPGTINQQFGRKLLEKSAKIGMSPQLVQWAVKKEMSLKPRNSTREKWALVTLW